MKVLFDSNVYISWIREYKHKDIMLSPYTQKYLSSIVLMELWAGCKTKKSIRLIENLQGPYLKTKRIVTPSVKNYILAGQIISDLPVNYKNKKKDSSFINDIIIAVTAFSTGSILYTENESDFKIINKYLKGMKIKYL